MPSFVLTIFQELPPVFVRDGAAELHRLVRAVGDKHLRNRTAIELVLVRGQFVDLHTLADHLAFVLIALPLAHEWIVCSRNGAG
jgi:hypothetical protein